MEESNSQLPEWESPLEKLWDILMFRTFILSSLLKTLNLLALLFALVKNAKSNCLSKKRYSLKAITMKSWLFKSLGGKNVVKFIRLKEVSNTYEENNKAKNKD